MKVKRHNYRKIYEQYHGSIPIDECGKKRKSHGT